MSFTQSFKCSFQSSWTGEEELTILQTEVINSTCPFWDVPPFGDLPPFGAVLCLAYGIPVHGGEVGISQVNREGSLNLLRLHMLLLRGRVYVVNTPGIEGTDGFLEALNTTNIWTCHISAATNLNNEKLLWHTIYWIKNYTKMYINKYIYTHTYIYTHKYTHTHIHTHIYINNKCFLSTECMHVCMYVCSKNTYYQCWKQLCCLIFLWKTMTIFLWKKVNITAFFFFI